MGVKKVICSKCGLPKELCICETLAKEARKITISLVQKRYGKHTTVIRGLDSSRIGIKGLMKKLKSRLACGGTYKNDEIELQGDHKQKVKQLLVKEGFPEDIIEIR